ncbi:MAG: hypothetical protein WBX11_10945 [Thiobacillaceae bacterium]
MKSTTDQDFPATRVEFPVGKAFQVNPGEPLWKRVPTHDDSGKLLADFMVLIPKLKSRPRHYIESAATYINAVLLRYDEVVFADVNLELNLLWVSHRYRSGLMLEIVSTLRARLPEAVLVAHQCAPSN